MSVAGLVLAAGLSTRMGARNKLLLEVDGAPMVRRVVDTALDAGLDPVVVVVGAPGTEVRAALAGMSVTFAENGRPADGLGSSVGVGMRALGGAGGAEAPDRVAVLLGDMPWVRSDDVRALRDAFDPAAGREICVPVHGGRRGNPVLWARRFFPELTRLPGDIGARPLLARYAPHVCEVEVAHSGVLRDVDTLDALTAEAARE